MQANGNRTSYSYDGLNRRTAAQDALNNVTTTAYDPVGNVTAVTEPVSAGVTRTTTYAYDWANRETLTTDPLPRTATTLYDSAGRVTASIDFRGQETDYQYDAADRRTRVSDPLQKVTTTAYDNAGNVTQVTDPKGKSSYTAYDGDNRAVAVQDFTGKQARTNYDPAGNVVASVDFRGMPSFAGYDKLNRATRATAPVGEASRTQFDPAARPSAAIDPRGFRTTGVYDPAGRQTNTIDPLSRTATLAYDPANNLTASTDPTGRTTTYQYDVLNRLTTVADPDGHTTTTAYDAAGRVTSTTDPLNHTTTFGYDLADRRTAITDPRGATTTVLYDKGDNVTAVTDANNWTTTYAYDSDDNKTAATDPQGNTATYAYDGDNRLTLAYDRLGRSRAMQYDDDGRLTQEVWKDAGGAATATYTYAYDEDGNQTSASNPVGTYSYAYDFDGRVTAVTDPFSLTLTYGYDDSGNRTLVQDSKGGTTTSVYDGLNRLTSRRFGDGTAALRFDEGWTPRGELASVQRFQDVAGTQQAGISSFTYDPVSGLVKTIYHYGGGTPASPYSGTVLASYVYNYDAVNRLSTEVDNGGATITYQYDAASQVTQDAVTSYTWDSAGNRTNAGFSQGSNKGDQLATDGTWTYTYDAEGNQTQKSKGPSAETWVFAYDNKNHLISALDKPTPTGTPTLTITYDYDALGRRVRRAVTSGGTTTTTVYAQDGQNTWADLDQGGNVQTRRLFLDGVDQVVAKVSYGPVAVSWYVADRQGSVRGLMSNAGALTASQAFDAFGNVQGTPIGDRYAYTGRERDESTGLQYHGERWYDPATMRWTSRDPIEFASGDADPYRYVSNNATNATDPSGLADEADSEAGWADLPVSFLKGVGDTFAPGWDQPQKELERKLLKGYFEATDFSFRVAIPYTIDKIAFALGLRDEDPTQPDRHETTWSTITLADIDDYFKPNFPKDDRWMRYTFTYPPGYLRREWNKQFEGMTPEEKERAVNRMLARDAGRLASGFFLFRGLSGPAEAAEGRALEAQIARKEARVVPRARVAPKAPAALRAKAEAAEVAPRPPMAPEPAPPAQGAAEGAARRKGKLPEIEGHRDLPVVSQGHCMPA